MGFSLNAVFNVDFDQTRLVPTDSFVLACVELEEKSFIPLQTVTPVYGGRVFFISIRNISLVS